MNILRRTLGGISKSPWAVVLLLISLWALWIALNLTYEDYSTTLAAYQMFPTRKINQDVVAQAAWLPQLMPVLLGFMFIRDTNRKLYALGAIGIMLLDMGADVWFKTQGLSAGWTVIGVAETFFVYTMGSEVMMTVAISIVMFILRDALMQLVYILRGAVDFMQDLWVALMENDEAPRGGSGVPSYRPPTTFQQSNAYRPPNSPLKGSPPTSPFRFVGDLEKDKKEKGKDLPHLP